MCGVARFVEKSLVPMPPACAAEGIVSVVPRVTQGLGAERADTSLVRASYRAMRASASIDGPWATLCDAAISRVTDGFAVLWSRDSRASELRLRAVSSSAPSAALAPALLRGRSALERLALQNAPRPTHWPRPERSSRDGERAAFDRYDEAVVVPIAIDCELDAIFVVASNEPLGAALLDELSSLALVAGLESRRRALVAQLEAPRSSVALAQRSLPIERLSAGVAHDLNNALSVVFSRTELMLEELSENELLRSDVESVREAGVRAAALTRWLSSFGFPPSFAPQAVSLTEVLDTTLPLLSRVLREDVTIGRPAARDIAAVHVDTWHLERLLAHLLSTVCDCVSTRGRLEVELADVTLREAPAGHVVGAFSPGSYVAVVLRATDETGVAVDAPARSGWHDELLAVAPFVRAIGASLYADECAAAPEVRLLLLRARPPQREDEPDARRRRGGETLLVVEDDAAVRRGLVAVLRRAGYAVLEAASAGDARACSAAHSGSIDLVLTDVVLPDGDGIALAQELRTKRPAARALFASGHAPDVLAMHPSIHPARLLNKPLFPEVLRRAVREALDAPADAQSA